MKIFVLGAIGLVVATTVVGGATAATPTLTGTDGPGFTITLTQGGKKVTSLNAGPYRLVIRDRSKMHSFVLEGPGVERDVTTVPFQGTKTVTVKLRPGKYKFYCRPHESSMFGFVKVT